MRIKTALQQYHNPMGIHSLQPHLTQLLCPLPKCSLLPAKPRMSWMPSACRRSSLAEAASQTTAPPAAQLCPVKGQSENKHMMIVLAAFLCRLLARMGAGTWTGRGAGGGAHRPWLHKWSASSNLDIETQSNMLIQRLH